MTASGAFSDILLVAGIMAQEPNIVIRFSQDSIIGSWYNWLMANITYFVCHNFILDELSFFAQAQSLTKLKVLMVGRCPSVQ